MALMPGAFRKFRSAWISYLVLFLWAFLTTSYYIAGAIALRAEFFDAHRLTNDPFYLGSDGQTITSVRPEAKNAGLAPGAFVLSLNRQPFTGDFQKNNILRRAKPGQDLEIRFRSADGRINEARIRLSHREGPGFTVGGYIAFIVPVLGVPLLSLLVGFWVVAARPRDPNAWLVLLLLSAVETTFGNLDWGLWTGPWFVIFWFSNAFLQLLMFPALLLLGVYFPERWRVDRRWPWLKWLILITAAWSFGVNFLYSAIKEFDIRGMASISRLESFTDHLDGIIEITCILLFLAAVFDKLWSASTRDARRRMRVFAVGSAFSLGPLLVLFGVLPYFGYDAHHGALYEVVVPFVALFPLTLAYVVVVQRAMDVHILLRMGTKYLLARATLILFEVGISTLLFVRVVMPMTQRRAHPVLNLILIALIVIGLFRAFAVRDSLSSRLQRWLDKKFFREAYQAEIVLSELAEHARNFTDKGPLLETVSRRISEVLHVPQIAVWIRSSNAVDRCIQTHGNRRADRALGDDSKLGASELSIDTLS